MDNGHDGSGSREVGKAVSPVGEAFAAQTAEEFIPLAGVLELPSREALAVDDHAGAQFEERVARFVAF